MNDFWYLLDIIFTKLLSRSSACWSYVFLFSQSVDELYVMMCNDVIY